MRPDGIERICRLTPLQEGMFFEALRKQGTTEVIYQVVMELTGRLSPALLGKAWQVVLHRHPILRTSFHYERLDAPVQVAHKNVTLPWKVHDWRELPEEEWRSRLYHFVGDDRQQPFDLARAPLMRASLVHGSGERSFLVWTYHHLLLDGWSTYLVLGDLFRCYRELAAGRDPGGARPRPYWEYVAWLQQRDHSGEEEYWRKRLDGIAAPTPLGHDSVEPDSQAAESAEVELTFTADQAGPLEEFARQHHITLGSALQAAWAITLSRYSGHQDVVFGGIVSGRSPEFAGIDDIVGLFINVLPVRVQVDDQASTVTWLSSFQAQLAEERQYDAVPLAAVQRWSGLPRGLPLFESLAVFINYPVQRGWTDGGTVQVSGSQVLQQPHYPLHLTGIAGERGWRLTLGYDSRRFRPTTVRRLGDLFTGVLGELAVAPRLADLPRWPPAMPLAERGDDDPPAGETAGDLVEAAAAWHPAAIAVEHEGNQLTYAALLERADALGRALRARGARPGTTVAVRMPSSLALAVALVAVTRSGAAISMGEPESLAVGLVVTRDPASDDPRLVLVSEEGLPLEAAADSGGSETAATDGVPTGFGFAPALVTSTDTGEPVVISQAGLALQLWWLQRAMPLRPADQVAHLGRRGDARLARDLLWALAAGASVLIAPDDDCPLRATAVWLGRQATLVPGAGPRLRQLVADGPLVTATRVRLAERAGLEVIEEFPATGPDASSVFFSPGWTEPKVSPPVGRRAGTRRVLAPATPDPAEGLWAVCSVLARHGAVRDVAARVVPQADGSPQVVAYLVVGDGEAAAAELTELAAAHLPAGLVPARFVVLDAMPLDEAGDVDWDALPAGSPETGPGRPGSPQDEITGVVSAIWGQALGFETATVRADDNFFDHGGHSLLAIKLVSRVRDLLGANFTLNHLFSDPTVAGVVRSVRAALASGQQQTERAAIPRADRGQPLPASFAQESMWFIEQTGGGGSASVLLPSRLGFRLEPDLLSAALTALTARHEVLRSRLAWRDGTVVAVIDPARDVEVDFTDLSAMPGQLAEQRARELLAQLASREFALDAERPMRAHLIRLGPEDHVLGLCLHHSVMDGWSMGILYGELNALYRAALAGEAAELPPLPVQYADFAAWQRETLAGARLDELMSYWSGHLAGTPDLLDLDGRIASPQAADEGGAERVFLDPEVAAGVARLAAAETATTSMVMLAAAAVVLSRHAPHPGLVVGMATAGRDHPQLENLIGFFVSTLALHLDTTGEPAFRELLRRVRQVTVQGLAHHELPIEKLVSTLRPGRSADHRPLVQVQYTFQSAPFQPVEFSGRSVSHFPVPHELSIYEINFEIYHWQGGLQCVLHHDAHYRPGYIASLAAEYADVVRAAIADPDSTIGATAGPRAVPPSASSLDLLRALAGPGDDGRDTTGPTGGGEERG